ncbi:Predicted dithiol-disulfide isomerase, DsbA family [Paenibacillus algorifonticola]|uniref:Predicted dithiol-disulfide isomerase, DsbA family n=1 Tax=Paenibacillus algorifonticola TaxID=684063 RepID=A0A1I2DPC1_9BACL|nr:DsbA family oxidoreductase [Paenibacillus algorifonticola]SFE82113.1 Predicted dithiol-disulfide isomerase, DsbA family [Paenibacillus algorifonticola]
MKIEVWSDFACPFCFIGKQRFETALEQFANKDDVQVVFKSFEIDPQAPKSVDHDVHDMLVGKYGMNRHQAIAMNNNIGKEAEDAGLAFQFDSIQLTNTFDAHRLAKYALEQGKERILQDFFKAYFMEGRHLGDHETLIELAVQAGFNVDEIRHVLGGDDYAEEVRADEEKAQRLGATGVPFFVIDRKYALSGAQSSDKFLQTLTTAWKDSQLLQVLNDTAKDSKSTDTCCDGACSIK